MNVACTQCGTPSVRGNRFCGRCGSPLPPSTGNLPTPTPTAPPIASARGRAATSCWQCGGPVDLLNQLTCTTCGARLVAGPPSAGGTPPPGPTGAPPPPPAAPVAPLAHPTPAEADAAARTIAKEPLLSGAALTLIVAILIVLALAVVGIVAGQAI